MLPRFKVSEAGVTTRRQRDDGPWEIGHGLKAMWTPGASMGQTVLHLQRPAGGGGVLFSGRNAGYDDITESVSSFAVEDDHSSSEHAESLATLADAADDWDFEWLLPARGAPLRFASPQLAREALGAASRHAAAAARAGAT